MEEIKENSNNAKDINRLEEKIDNIEKMVQAITMHEMTLIGVVYAILESLSDAKFEPIKMRQREMEERIQALMADNVSSKKKSTR